LARIAVIARTTGAADIAEQRRLRLAASDQVLRISRVRIAEDDRAASYETVVLPLGRFLGLSTQSGVTDDIATLARRHGLALGRATEKVDTAQASPEVVEHLGIEPDEAVLKLDRVVQSGDGLPVEWRVAFLCLGSYDPDPLTHSVVQFRCWCAHRCPGNPARRTDRLPEPDLGNSALCKCPHGRCDDTQHESEAGRKRLSMVITRVA